MKRWDWIQKGKVHTQKGKRPKRARKLMSTQRNEKFKSNGKVKQNKTKKANKRKVNALGDC